MISAAFILAPMTPATVLVFSALMGALWLATVPLTSGLVAQIYGAALHGHALRHRVPQPPARQLHRRLARRRLYDLYGNYDLVWWIGVGVGLFSALVHLPIRETPASLQAA